MISRPRRNLKLNNKREKSKRSGMEGRAFDGEKAKVENGRKRERKRERRVGVKRSTAPRASSPAAPGARRSAAPSPARQSRRRRPAKQKEQVKRRCSRTAENGAIAHLRRVRASPCERGYARMRARACVRGRVRAGVCARVSAQAFLFVTHTYKNKTLSQAHAWSLVSLQARVAARRCACSRMVVMMPSLRLSSSCLPS
eukprot:2001813-Pleurochrysis_carterae.AAC.1